MRIGRLNKRVTFQEVTETRDAYGGVIETWSHFATVWASIEPIAGREYFVAKQTAADTTHRVRIRYLEGLVPKMIMVCDDRTFGIDSIINFGERNAEMEIMVTESI